MKRSRDMIKLRWHHLAQPIQSRWSKLTKGDVAGAGGREYLTARVQERYGLVKDEAHRQVWDFTRSL